MIGTVFDIKELAVHDGPGIRTTVFLKGCPLRCKWCHNPEGLSSLPQLMYRGGSCLHCGKCLKGCNHPECQPYGRCIHACPEGLLSVSGRKVTAEELAEELKSSAAMLDHEFGGVTFSGGEPLFQWEFLTETAKMLDGIHLCIETSGYAENEVFKKVLDLMDFVIMDIKLADERAHIQYTGVSNRKILENFEELRKSGKPYLIRTPLIPGITDCRDNLEKIGEIIGDSGWEHIPYNRMAGAKYKMLGMDFPMDNT